MENTITTNIKITQTDYESFRIICIKKKLKIGEAIGDLISTEVKKNIKLIQPEASR